MQEAFARVHARFDRLDTPEAYLRTTILNGTRQHFRGAGRERARWRLVSSGAQRTDETSEVLLDAVAALPARQSAVIVLRYWADVDDHTIAATLGARPSTVRSLARRGLARLGKDFTS